VQSALRLFKLLAYISPSNVFFGKLFIQNSLIKPKSRRYRSASKRTDDNPQSAVLLVDLWINTGAKFQGSDTSLS